MTFKEQLLLTLIDKLAIGILILVAGLLFNRILERFKSKQAFSNEISKQRVAEIGSVCSHIYEWESSLGHTIERTEILKLHFKDNTEDIASRLKGQEDLPTKELVERKLYVLRISLGKSYFWLGEELYQHLVEYCLNIKEAFDAYLDEGLSEHFNELSGKLDQSRENIMNFLQSHR